MNPRLSFKLAGAFLFVVSLVDLLLCPHSKVEESFQLQATHDLFYYGLGPAVQHSLTFLAAESGNLPYDHVRFPGVVPRTFTGPLLLSSLCHLVRIIFLPIIDIATNPMLVQFLARFFLLCINVHGWIQLAMAVDNSYKGITVGSGGAGTNTYLGSWLLVITACQFHMPFYASRMLPNIFALVVVLHSYSYWIQGKVRLAAAGIVFGTTVFRCDLLLLLLSLGISWLVTQKLTIPEALKIGVVTGVLSLILTVPMDSILWQRILWPEGEVFYFNTILGKSSAWGTSPWHWYFTSAIPKSMLFTTFLIPLSFLRIPEALIAWETRWRLKGTTPTTAKAKASLVDFKSPSFQYFIPIIGFIIVYSFLGHKEMRFIFPAMPILNLAAANGMTRLSHLAFPAKDKESSWLARFGFLGGVVSILLTLVGSLAFVAVSRWNYPGGDALVRLSHYISEQSAPTSANGRKSVRVYIDVASAMSGVSLFGQRAAQLSTPGIEWEFDKGGYEEENAIINTDGYGEFTHMLSESQGLSPEFVVIQTIQGTPRLNFRRGTVSSEDSIYILEHKWWKSPNTRTD